nr:probable glycosyltransferase At5g03795 [Tanacetum cinerariifolium]
MSSPKPPPQYFTSITTKQALILILSTLTLITFTYISFTSVRPTLNYTSYTSLSYPQPTTSSHVDVEVEESGSGGFTDVYHVPEVFKLNYAEMERRFKVYIYPDGDPKTFYQTPRKLTGKYASEGYFFQNIRESKFRTEDPDEADLFFIPISCHKMRGK